VNIPFNRLAATLIGRVLLTAMLAAPAQAGRIVQTTADPNTGLTTKLVTVYKRNGDVRKYKSVVKETKEPKKSQGSSGKGVVGDDGAYGAERHWP
jgi:hypothetical protein